MRAALYARVSTDKQAEKYGIPSQVEALRNRCLERGWSALPDADKETFVDDGYSGSELARPALNRLREVVQKGQVDVVLAYDPDRLSRNLADLLLWRATSQNTASSWSSSPRRRIPRLKARCSLPFAEP